MKLCLRDISPKGLTIKDYLSLQSLNDRMAEGSNNEIVFLTPPEVNLTVYGSERGAETRGSVRTRYRQPCARCLKELEMDLEVEANFILKPKPPRETACVRSDADIEDVGIVYFEGEHIDLEDILQETLILALSPFLLPPKDKEGRCTMCGETCPKEYTFEGCASNNLGELLFKAGVKGAGKGRSRS
mgnify:CR=1 FL=1